MLRSSCRLLSGGGQDGLLPTSKAEAHLAFKWVLSRPPQPPPGRGMCYVECFSPATPSKFQTQKVDTVTRRSVPLRSSMPSLKCRPTRPSLESMNLTVSGIKYAMHDMPGDASRSRDTSSSCKQGSKAKTQLYMSCERHETKRAFTDGEVDTATCQAYIEKRVLEASGKTVDYNPNGYTKESSPWDAKIQPTNVNPSAASSTKK